MRKGFIIDYETVAAHLANEEAKIQAGFVATFLKELRQAAGTAYNTEMQLCWVNDKGKRRGFSRPLDPLVMRFLEVTP